MRQRLSFDAWGNRRNPLTGAADTTIAKTLLFARGYTGHEHLDELGLINMNGRIYDPALGMFLSPDNYVQAPDNTQNFNRYAYCVNNPLMYTDPSGEFFCYLMPSMSYSQSGGVSYGLTFGIGINNVLSVNLNVSYCPGNKDVSISLGASAWCASAYVGFGTGSGLFAGASAGIGSSSPFSNNMFSAGVNYSQKGGLTGNYFGYTTNFHGNTSYDPSFTLSYSFTVYDSNSAENRNERHNRENIARIIDGKLIVDASAGGYGEGLDVNGYLDPTFKKLGFLPDYDENGSAYYSACYSISVSAVYKNQVLTLYANSSPTELSDYTITAAAKASLIINGKTIATQNFTNDGGNYFPQPGVDYVGSTSFKLPSLNGNIQVQVWANWIAHTDAGGAISPVYYPPFLGIPISVNEYIKIH